MDCERDYCKRANLQSGKRNTRKEGGKAPFLNPLKQLLRFPFPNPSLERALLLSKSTDVLYGRDYIFSRSFSSASKLILFKVLAYDLYI